jgi:tetratricopeptide (TPR) repeat protein
VYRAQEPGAARTRQTWDEARAMLAALGGPEQLPALAQGVDEQVHEVERLAAEVHEGAPGSPRELDAQYALANAYAVADRVDEARAAFERLVLLAEPLSIRDHRVVEALTQIASLHAEAGRGAAALPVAERAVAEATALGDPAALSSAQHMLGWARSNRR